MKAVDNDERMPRLKQNEISEEADKQLLSQTVDNLAFEVLTDIVKE